MSVPPAQPEYIAARRVLLDALGALEGHRNAVILVGSQAIYARTGAADFDVAVAAYTTDADLAFDPRLLGPTPQIDQAMMAAGFTRSRQPGTWLAELAVGGRGITVPVDLLVPEALAGAGRRAARLSAHAPRVARRTPGLEAVLADHGPISIASLEVSDARILDVSVAGVAALFVAKAHKLFERINAKPFKPARVLPKDASDVYRLMQAEPAAHVGRRLRDLADDAVAGPAVRRGVDYIHRLFSRRGLPGVQLAVDALSAGGVPGVMVEAVLVAYTKELTAAYSQTAEDRSGA